MDKPTRTDLLRTAGAARRFLRTLRLKLMNHPQLYRSELAYCESVTKRICRAIKETKPDAQEQRQALPDLTNPTRRTPLPDSPREVDKASDESRAPCDSGGPAGHRDP